MELRVWTTVGLALVVAACDGSNASKDDGGGPRTDLGTPSALDANTPGIDTGPAPLPMDGGGVVVRPDAELPRDDAGNLALPRPPETCARPMELRRVDTSTPRTRVGTGTPASCTEQALRTAIAGGGIVTFDCGAQPVTIQLTQELVATNSVDLVLDGGGLVTLSGGGTTRILKIDACVNPVSPRCDNDGRPRVTLQRLTFRDGHSRAPMPETKSTDSGGGAIMRTGGTLTVIDCDFVNNTCDEYGQDVSGGAITSRQSTPTRIAGSNFVGNSCANGGAIGGLQASYTIVNSTFTSNAATGSGGNRVPSAMRMAMGDTGGDGGNGGAMVFDGQNNPISMCGINAVGNLAHYAGSAIFRTGYNGEAFSITDSTFDGNVMDDLGIPESNFDRNNAGLGTLYIQGVTATIERVAITNNRSNKGTAGLFTATMGPTNRLDLTNVTIAGNVLRGTAIGGAFQGGGVPGTWTNCTISDNAANFGGGLIFANNLTLRNCIIANNRRDESNDPGLYNPRNCFPATSVPMSGGPNLQWPMTNPRGLMAEPPCAPGITFADPQLAPLANGVAVPMAGSPAIGAGRGCPAVDQRGRPRNANACALGAAEP